MKPLKYQMEIMRCFNKITSKTTYFLRKCDVMSRISKVDYDKIYDGCDGFSCAYSTFDVRFNRHFITAVFEGK